MPWLGSMLSDLWALVRREAELAKADTSEFRALGVRAGGLAAMAAGLALVGAIYITVAVTLALSLWLAPWQSALLMALGLLVFAALFALAARSQYRRLSRLPKQFFKTVSDDVRLAAAPMPSRFRQR